jgi:hypothetical protein
MSTRLAAAATLILLVLARHRLVDVVREATRGGIEAWQVDMWGMLVAGGVLVALVGVGVVVWVGSAIEERRA